MLHIMEELFSEGVEWIMKICIASILWFNAKMKLRELMAIVEIDLSSSLPAIILNNRN